ncbi:hypothetical protein B0H11DRAFT_1714744, partial [Mycena galericulata]
SWLAQANSVFTQLRIKSNHEDYGASSSGSSSPYIELTSTAVVIDWVKYSLDIEEPMHDLPQSYLFVCPVDNLRTGPTTFRWPSCPAYWSLDPSGVERLRTDEAERLGFPSIEIVAAVEGFSWDSSVYAGLRKFHQGKGFDPDSGDVARHLGLPLYQLCSEIEMPFAHGEGK